MYYVIQFANGSFDNGLKDGPTTVEDVQNAATYFRSTACARLSELLSENPSMKATIVPVQATSRTTREPVRCDLKGAEGFVIHFPGPKAYDNGGEMNHLFGDLKHARVYPNLKEASRRVLEMGAYDKGTYHDAVIEPVAYKITSETTISLRD